MKMFSKTKKVCYKKATNGKQKENDLKEREFRKGPLACQSAKLSLGLKRGNRVHVLTDKNTGRNILQNRGVSIPVYNSLVFASLS